MKLGKTALMSVVCAAALAAPRKAALRPRGKLAMALFLPLISILPLLLPFTAQAAIHLGSPNTVSLSQGLVGYWPLDGPVTNWNTNTTLDLSGNGNTGQLISMSTSSSPVAGKIGQALDFNGSSGEITTTNQVSDPQTFTLSAWFKTTVASGHKIVEFEQTQSGTNPPNWDRLLNLGTDGKVYFVTYQGSAHYVTSSAALADGNWHHALGTFNGSSGTLYIDGVPQDTFTGGADSYAGYWHIGGYKAAGAWPNGADGYFHGKIDDVRIYNRALSAGEVKQLYHQGAATIGHSDENFMSNGLVGYWTFDGPAINWATGQTQDISGQGNTGQLISMSTSTSPVAGKIGQALFFNNSSSYVTMPSIASSKQTMTAWVNETSRPTDSDPDWVDAILWNWANRLTPAHV